MYSRTHAPCRHDLDVAGTWRRTRVHAARRRGILVARPDRSTKDRTGSNLPLAVSILTDYFLFVNYISLGSFVSLELFLVSFLAVVLRNHRNHGVIETMTTTREHQEG